MTREQAKELLPVMQAWVDGGSLQWKDVNNKWCDTTHLSFVDEYTYRIKPEPKLRPWKPEEVPVGAAFRHGNAGLPTGWIDTTPGGVVLGLNYKLIPFKQLYEQWTHSTDHGKTWLPCGVAE